jgi:hypothetical protein
MSKSERFIKVYQEGSLLKDGVRQVIVDTETGVNYLFNQAGYAGGLTPLLDEDGKPIVTLIENK